jgi:hypothetical protein
MDEQAKLTRRSMLRCAALLAGGTLAAGVIQIKPAYAQKAGKDAVKYQDSPKDGQKCADCLYFQAPGSCAVVEGPISPNGWCSLYNKKS